MVDLLRSLGLSSETESSSSSSAGGHPPAAAPFRYLAASSEVAQYQHPSFQSLELLLPASLWSDSFVQERARYTLQPRHPSSLSAPANGATSGPSSSHACCGSMQTLAVTTAVLETQRRASSTGVGGCLPSGTPGRWSLMAIYRNFKRAREEAPMWEKVFEGPRRVGLVDSAVEETSACRHRALSPPIDSLASSSASLVNDGSVTKGDDRREEVTVPSHGLSSSCSFASTVSRAESINPAGVSEADTRNAKAPECQVRSSASPVSVRAPATPLTAAHAEALRVFKTVLDRVSAVHEICCPLCSPPRPPRWGLCGQPALPNRPVLAHGPHARTNKDAPIDPEESQVANGHVRNAHELSADVATLNGTEAYRQHLLHRVRSLLSHHDDRLRCLSETKPTRLHVAVELHPLVVACAQLGGLPLLRALSVTL
ncbi:hypothetical protein LSCM1_06925 [Leishmania martiniquensis]|uniref:Uncharacterized protein n=1 Tax=Leishmania martiniquensis TaxID=1580590 RepID=A0A836HU06_9TRYP|nr:hypothetical protein LSCM1_06925 [Leishmania martiniquensis]